MITSARPTAYSYVRMSSKQQLRGDSRRRQLELSEAFSNRRGEVKLFRVFPGQVAIASSAIDANRLYLTKHRGWHWFSEVLACTTNGGKHIHMPSKAVHLTCCRISCQRRCLQSDGKN